MADSIDQIISKQAIESITKADKEIQNLNKGYMGLIETLKKGEAEFKESAKTVSDLKKHTKGLNETEKERDKLSKQLQASQEKLNDIEDKRTKEIIQNQQALNRRKKELRDQAKAEDQVNERMKAGVKDARKLSKQYDNLSKELNENRKLAKDIAVAYGVNSKEFKKAAKRVNELDKEVKEIDTSLGQSQRKVGEYGSAWSGIREKFAAVAAKGLALIGIFKGMQAAIGYLDREDKLRQQIKIRFDETGEAASHMLVVLKTIGGYYEKDYNDILKSANVLHKEFGISGSAALSLIRQGFVRGADINGEFLELLKEYPAQLRSVGLSAEETIAIITETERQGVFSDKGIDAIKEAGIRLREMTPATQEALGNIGISSTELEKALRANSTSYFEAIQLISTKLGEVEAQSPEVGQAIADIFGGPGEDAGLQYLQTLKDINIELDNIEGALTINQIASMALSESWADLTTSASESTGTVAKLWGALQFEVATRIDDITSIFLSGEDVKVRESRRTKLRIERNIEDIAKVENRTRLEIVKDLIAFNKNVSGERTGQMESELEMLTEFKEKYLQAEAERLAKEAELQKQARQREIEKAKEQAIQVLKFKKQYGIASNEELFELEKQQLEASIGYSLAKEEERQQALAAIRKKYATRERSNDEIVIGLESLSLKEKEITSNTEEAKQKIRQRTEITAEQVHEGIIENLKEAAAEERAIREEAAALTISSAFEFLDIRSQMLSNELESIRQQKEHELQMAGDNAGQKAQIEERYAQKEKQIRVKQAKNQQTQATFNALLNSYEAFSKALTLGPILGPILGSVVLALGLARVAAIQSQPLPQFKEGTKGMFSTPDTFVTSEPGAGTEWIEKAGKIIETTQPTLHTNSAGARVYSNKEIERLTNVKEVGYDSREIRNVKRSIDDGFNRLIKANKRQPIYSEKVIGFTEPNYMRKYLNR